MSASTGMIVGVAVLGLAAAWAFSSKVEAEKLKAQQPARTNADLLGLMQVAGGIIAMF